MQIDADADPGTALTLCGTAHDAMLAAAAGAAPYEACGLLFGTDTQILQAQAAANVAADPLTRFEIDPAALIAAHRAARAGGAPLIGYFHSHPTGHPVPSATDCAHAGGDGRIWAIVAARRIGLWRDTATGFAAMSYITDSE